MSTNNCSIPNENINFTINIGIHVFILFCFLSIFFLAYVAELAKGHFDEEIHHSLEKGIKGSLENLDPLQQLRIKKMINNAPLDRLINHYDKPSKPVDVNNTWLTRMVILINIFLLILISSTSYLLRWSCNQCVPIKDIVIENAIIFTFIGIVEIVFFKMVAFKYIPVKPSTIVTSAIDSLKKNL